MRIKSPDEYDSILIVEDDSDIADLIQFHLRNEGFVVNKAYDGESALKKADEKNFDLIVLDLILPKKSGMDVFLELRSKSKTKNIPVIILSAKGQAADRVAGLEAGADDYMIKPFSPKELILRIQKQLAFVAQKKEGYLYVVDGLTFDRVQLTFQYETQQVSLTSIEFKLLLYLCERPNQVQQRATLLKQVWGYAADVNSRTLDTHIKRIRTKIGSLAERIKTVRGQGYVFLVRDE